MIEAKISHLSWVMKSKCGTKSSKKSRKEQIVGFFEEIFYKYFVQSTIGLVPKAGNKTHLIFHLSYDFPDSKEGDQ